MVAFFRQSKGVFQQAVDFSHLNQTGLCRSPPIPFKAGVVSRRLGTPSVRSRRPSSPSGPNRLIRTFSSPAARVRQLLLWHCVSSSSGAHQRGQFRPVKASGTFCVLVAYTDTQKVLRASRESEEMRFAVQPNG